MNESDARNAILVRAYETAAPTAHHAEWADDDRMWATRAALQAEGEHAAFDAFVARRSRLASERLCSRDPAISRAVRALTWWPWIGWALALAALFAGIATDALGPARQINVLAPPLIGVLVWNLAVYALLAWRAALRRSGAGPLTRLAALAAHAIAPARRIERLPPPLAVFTRDWMTASAPLAAPRIARVLHAAAAAFACGALLGMYLRGFALEYRAVWESTFLDATTVHAILSVMLGPAAALTGIALPDAAGLEAIRASASPGENAARWIHLYAVTVVLAVLVPRGLMAVALYVAERRLATRFPLALDDGYFRALARASRGEAAAIRIVPYGYSPATQAVTGLDALMSRVFDGPAEVTISPAVPFGAEDTLDPTVIPSAPLALAAALFQLTATPERENHGAFVDALAARVPPSTPFAVLVDESAFRSRFEQSGSGTTRRSERRAAWQRMLGEAGREAVFVDLESRDFTDAADAVRTVVEAATRRTVHG